MVGHPDIWKSRHGLCPACRRIVVEFGSGSVSNVNAWDKTRRLAWPAAIARAAIGPYVPQEFAGDYREAVDVIPASPKASAALSRRCLQYLIREKAGIKKRDLAQEIEEVMKVLPAHLAEAVDGVRNIGNFAAHPMKSTNTGEVLDVEPGEAEWLLETLEGLFDFYFTQPALLAAKRAALNKKLAEAGKPPVK
jgi:hypothetical protein